MDRQAPRNITESDLENILLDEAAEPGVFPLPLLKKITNGFHHDQEIGRGEVGQVYKGVLANRVVVVKRLSNKSFDEHEFLGKVQRLMKVKHKNIVQFLGYCSYVQTEMQKYNGRLLMVDIQERLLCFEYLSNGSLDVYIKDASGGLEWRTRYRIIKGICEGLHSLHHMNIMHLNLKPSNILMDDNFMPKITDFGIWTSLDFWEDLYNREVHPSIMFGTRYMAPELPHHVTCKSDLYSLGVIIMEIVTGGKDRQAIEDILESWGKRMELSQGNQQWEQIRACAEIGIQCTNINPAMRPVSMKHIIARLAETENTEIHHFTFQNLKEITNNFDKEIGRGGFGVVYKGVLQSGEVVAVKKLVQAMPTSQKQFENEVNLLMTLKHPNIVRLVGYCYKTQHLHTPHEGKFVFAEKTESLLCLEYLPNGSLKEYISDASSGFDWHTRWKIIKGVCFGLKYLHEQSNGPIVHLDLKPANILLDENMVPNIADFGISRLFDKKHTIHTAIISGTLGYMAQEYFRGIITPMSDIFSLGVIIMELITGHRDYPNDIRTSSVGFIELEVQKWKKVLQEKLDYTSLEICCQQIKRCIQIGLICVNPERTKRPTMKEVVDMLQGREHMSWHFSNELSCLSIQEEP